MESATEIPSGWLERIAGLSDRQRRRLAHALRGVAGVDVASLRLIAYVVPRARTTFDVVELRDHLAAELPSALVPARFLVLDDLPVLPSGKVDRQALPDPEFDRATSHAAYVAPRSATETALATVWADVLGVPSVGVNDGFWELGGQSLLAARIMARVRGVTGTDLGVRALFEEPTIAGLAARIDARTVASAARGRVPLVRVPRSVDLPLSTAQQRHWFLQALDPESVAYNICDTLRITGELDVAALAGAARAFADRHEILRTRFLPQRAVPRPRISDDPPDLLRCTDLRGHEPADREVAARALLTADRQRPFDLAELPLLRLHLVRLDENEFLLGVVAHHIVADDWAFNVLYSELGALYATVVGTTSAPLPALPVQYADYAVWERRMLSDALADGGATRRADLVDAPVDALLAPDGGDEGDGLTCFTLAAEATTALAAWSAARSTTLFATCLAAFAASLGEHARRDDLVVGVPFANRDQPEFQTLFGCFINPAAIRLDLSGEPGAAELVRRADAALGAAHGLQHVPFERVVDAVRSARLAAGHPQPRAPLFPVVLNFVDAPAELVLPGAQVWQIDLGGAPRPKYDLTCYLERSPNGLRGRLVYPPDRFSARLVESLAQRLRNWLLAVLAGQPDARKVSTP
jgi:hypothetical protein